MVIVEHIPLAVLVALAFIGIEHRSKRQVASAESDVSPVGLAALRQEISRLPWRQRLGYGLLMALSLAQLSPAAWQTDSLLRSAILVTLAWSALTWLWAEDRHLTARRILMRACIWFPAWVLASQASLPEGALLVAGCCIVFLGLGIIEDVRVGKLSPTKPFRFGGTVHPNRQAVNCTYLLFAVVYLYQCGYVSLTACLVVGGVALVLLILTRSRATFLATLVAGGVWAQTASTWSWSTTDWIATVIGATMAAIVLYARPALWQRLKTVVLLGRSRRVRHLNGRFFLWNYAWQAVGRRLPVGFGVGSFWNAERNGDIARMKEWVPRHSHSMYVDVLLDTGLIGLGLFVAVLVIGLGAAWQTPFPDGPFIFAVLVLVALNGIVESRCMAPQFAAFAIYLLLLAMP